MDAGGPPIEPEEQVIVNPDRVEARRFSRDRHLPDQRVGRHIRIAILLGDRQDDPDPHARSSGA